MRFVMLGTGTPSPSLVRQSSGYLIETDERTIVIDHGGGAFQRLLELGIRPQSVTDLVLSHLHSDHTLDIPRLVLTRWDQSRGDIEPLRIFGPKRVARMIERLFGKDGAFSDDINARRTHPASLAIYAARGGSGTRPAPAFDITEVSPGDRFALGKLAVEVGRSQHFEPLLDCLCFRFRSNDADLVYTGDTGFSPEVASFAAGCDVLVAMCQYLDGTPLPVSARDTAASHLEVARMASAASAGTLVVSHLSEQFDDPMVRGRAARAMSDIYSGPIVWGEDKLEFQLPGDGRGRRFD